MCYTKIRNKTETNKKTNKLTKNSAAEESRFELRGTKFIYIYIYIYEIYALTQIHVNKIGRAHV